MNKEKWREISNKEPESIFDPCFYVLYKKGVLTKKEFRQLLEREAEPKTVGDMLDEIDRILD